jgi:hypothetical protein
MVYTHEDICAKILTIAQLIVTTHCEQPTSPLIGDK